MALRSPLAEAAPSPGHVRWSDREVRRLLRSLRKPKVLEQSALGRALRAATGMPTAHRALLIVIERALSEYGRDGRMLTELLTKCDIEGVATHAEIAAGMNLSVRQFYRYRANAVRIIVAFVERVLVKDLREENAVRTFARLVENYDSEAAGEILQLDGGGGDQLIARARSAANLFWRGETKTGFASLERLHRILAHRDDVDRIAVKREIGLARFLAARYEGRPSKMLDVVRDLRALPAGSPRALALSTLCEAEAALHNGDLVSGKAALEILARSTTVRADLMLLGRTVLLLGETAFALGATAEAKRYASAAHLGLKRFPKERTESQILLDRLRLREGQPPRAERYDDLTPASHDALMCTAIAGRGALIVGDIPSAKQLTLKVLGVARERGYISIEVWCLATLCACAGTREEASKLAGQAWIKLMLTRDYRIAHDAYVCAALSPSSLGPITLDQTFLRTLSEGVEAAFASSPIAQVRPALHAFSDVVRDLVCAELGGPKKMYTGDDVAALAGILESAGVTAVQFRRNQRSVAATLSYFLSILLPVDMRTVFAQQLRQSLTDVFRDVAASLDTMPVDQCLA